MAIVPQAWRNLFGGPALTGECCINISSGSSNGPAAFSWNPDNLAANETVTTQFYYPPQQPLGVWNSQNPYWNGTTLMAGMVFLENTRTILYVGRHGTGPFCYGNGGATPPVSAPGGAKWCYDPVDSAKGGHAYPYVYQLWAYDANDLQQVMAGKRAPWSVTPYAVWNPPDLPFAAPDHRLNGVAYDPTTSRLFIEQARGDDVNPVIHVFHIAP
jgi:hypothetical protein